MHTENGAVRKEPVPEKAVSESGIRRYLRTSCFGREMEIHARLDSTNNRAKALAAAGAPHGFLVAADSQSAGRGRLGRSFWSEGAGVYMTLVLRPECAPEKVPMITSLAAVAAARAVEKCCGADVRIKWVNDLYIGSRKICGILCEAGFGAETGKPDYAVLGIGVNTARTEFPPELREIAGSVGNETGIVPDRNRLTAEILNELEAVYGQLETGEFLAESRRRSNVIGRDVLVIRGATQFPAKALDIDGEGRLVVRTGNSTESLGFGEVSLKLDR